MPRPPETLICPCFEARGTELDPRSTGTEASPWGLAGYTDSQSLCPGEGAQPRREREEERFGGVENWRRGFPSGVGFLSFVAGAPRNRVGKSLLGREIGPLSLLCVMI